MSIKKKKICVISQYYPDEKDMIYSFVDQLISEFVDYGCECIVISPQSVFEKNHKMNNRIKKTKQGNTIEIYCPKYITVPHRKIFGIDTYKITMGSYIHAIKTVYKKYVKNADLVYAHFLNPSGIAAATIGKKFNLPVYVACGESSLEPHKFAYELYKDYIRNHINGFIAVSSVLKRELRELNILRDNQTIIVEPNGVNMSQFNQIPKDIARKKLGIDEKDFIVCFVGHFIKRKGFEVLVEAANRNNNWKCIFIGSEYNTENIICNNTFFRGQLPHDEIGTYLTASDVFVLPTLAEGCCNAIVEAVVSGLPVVSSNLDFNDDILEDAYSIRVDPESVDDIYNAVEDIRLNKERALEMSKNAFLKAEKMNIKCRANRILHFICEEE